MASRDSGCGGCLALILGLAVLGWAIEGITYAWVHDWQVIVGLAISAATIGYLRLISREKDDA